MKEKNLHCYLCEKEKDVLIKVETNSELWASTEGICCDCFKGADFDQKIFLKSKKFLEKQVDESRGRLEYWEKELSGLTTSLSEKN